MDRIGKRHLFGSYLIYIKLFEILLKAVEKGKRGNVWFMDALLKVGEEERTMGEEVEKNRRI